MPTPAEPGLRSNLETPAEATGSEPRPGPGPGPGLCGSFPARGALPLGLGLLCGFGAQPPSAAAAARARCLLLADLRLLPPAVPEPAVAQRPVHPPPALGSQQRSDSVSTSGNLVNASRLQPSKGPEAPGSCLLAPREFSVLTDPCTSCRFPNPSFSSQAPFPQMGTTTKGSDGSCDQSRGLLSLSTWYQFWVADNPKDRCLCLASLRQSRQN